MSGNTISLQGAICVISKYVWMSIVLPSSLAPLSRMTHRPSSNFLRKKSRYPGSSMYCASAKKQSVSLSYFASNFGGITRASCIFLLPPAVQDFAHALKLPLLADFDERYDVGRELPCFR